MLKRFESLPARASGVRHLRNRGSALVCGFFGVFFIADAIALAITSAADSDPPISLGSCLFVLGLLLFGVWWTRVARTSVVIRADQPSFVLRNMYRRIEVPWSQVSGFEAAWPYIKRRPPRGWVVAHLKDGSKVPCQGLRGTAKTIGKFLDEMNSELATRA
ncbi:MAG: hypothetical protein QOJ85_759 [Solirubrobacteraceae bacterium]|nr:hypothetical protein [Solirubrobacteraceae bacterium]